MRHTLSFTAILFIFLLSYVPAHAQVGITATSFLQFNNHARSMGMGGGTVALRHHAGGAHVNPATIGNPGHVELTTQFHKLGNNNFPYYALGTDMSLENRDRSFYMPAFVITLDRWSFSYQLAYLDFTEQLHTTPSGEPLGTFSSNELAHTFTTAYRWSDYLSFGAGINIIRSKLVPSGIQVGGQESLVGSAVSLDLGAYGEYPYRINDNIKLTPSAGWSLTDFGNKIKYLDRSRGDPLPMMMRGGLGLQLEYTDPVEDIAILSDKIPVSVAYYRSFEKLMARVDTVGNAMGPFEALFNSWDTYRDHLGIGVQEFSLGEQIDHRGGLEIILFEMLSFRSGFSRDAEVNRGGQTSFFGVGFHYNMFSLDYVRQESQSERFNRDIEQNYWQFSLKFSIDRVEKWLGG